MILAVTPNPAIDVTYRTRALQHGEVHRVRVEKKAGGKGINVARVAQQLGAPIHAAGLVAGTAGEFIKNDIDKARIPATWIDAPGETRTTINVLTDDGESTMLNEPGPPASASAWNDLAKFVHTGSNRFNVCVVSGSLPPLPPQSSASEVYRPASEYQFSIIDTSGPFLLQAAEASPTLLKPNKSELLAATAQGSIQSGLASLRHKGAHNVAVSLGSDGMILATPQNAWRAWLEFPVFGNPTGAGDSAVAAFAHFAQEIGPDCLSRVHAPDVLRHVVALSAASVASETAGTVDIEFYKKLLDSVRLEKYHAAN